MIGCDNNDCPYQWVSTAYVSVLISRGRSHSRLAAFMGACSCNGSQHMSVATVHQGATPLLGSYEGSRKAVVAIVARSFHSEIF